MSRWLVTGAAGLLGQDLVNRLQLAGETVRGLARTDLDITQAGAVRQAVRDWRPDVVVNCAAWTDVDGAEAHEDQAMQVNGIGARLVAEACAVGGTRLIHLSTDYVFGGDKKLPYAEYDIPEPRTAYGRTKLTGEHAVLRLLPTSGFVVRTAWLYGPHGPNFVRTIMKLERELDTIDVVHDQYGQPTWTADVADQVITLARAPAPSGIYHATSSGATTWFGLASAVFRLMGAETARLRPVPSSAVPRPAFRPASTVLGHAAWERAGLRTIAGWRPRLQAAFQALTTADELT